MSSWAFDKSPSFSRILCSWFLSEENHAKPFQALAPSRCWSNWTGITATFSVLSLLGFSSGSGKCEWEDLSCLILGSSLRNLKRKCGQEQPVIENASFLPIKPPFSDAESKYIQITPKAIFFHDLIQSQDLLWDSFPEHRNKPKASLSKQSDPHAMFMRKMKSGMHVPCRDTPEGFKVKYPFFKDSFEFSYPDFMWGLKKDYHPLLWTWGCGPQLWAQFHIPPVPN